MQPFKIDDGNTGYAGGYNPLYVAKPRRNVRTLGICASIIFLFFFFTAPIRHHHPRHHAPWEPRDNNTVVHGKVVEIQPHFVDPPRPFPSSPMLLPVTTDPNATSKPWLAAVICAAKDTEHRMMIRASWMQLYKDVPFDGRFVVSNPGDWTEIVAQENSTFGDMIVLDHIEEDDITANTIKTLEFFKWLARSGLHYEYVTKMDTDLWLNAKLFWDRFLTPNLVQRPSGAWEATTSKTIIGELYYSYRWDLVFPHGSLYTATWDMVELLASLQERFHVVTGEDMAVASLMLRGHETANFINIRGTEKFNYDDSDSRGDGTAWSRKNSHHAAITHAVVDNRTVAVHDLKETSDWMKVAALFDANGVIPRPESTKPERLAWGTFWDDFFSTWWPSQRHRTRYDQAPDWLFELNEDGEWICDRIWNMGETRTGFLPE